MFAALFFERDPFRLSDLIIGTATWVQVVGGFALLGATIYLVVCLLTWKAKDYEEVPAWQRSLFLVTWLLAAASYCAGWTFHSIGLQQATQPGQLVRALVIANWCYLAGGIFAIVAVGVPFVITLTRMRIGRIFALANLSFKEALSVRVWVVFVLL